MTHTFLICSVGGSAAAIVASLQHWKPAKVNFVVSANTREIAEQVCREYAQAGGHLPPGCVDFVQIEDPETLSCVVDSVRDVARNVHEWTARGESYCVAADFTGGTKCMSVGLALVARRWPCSFSYVGGSQRGTGGVGTVESGSEHARSWGNPWEVLGYQTVEEAVTIFNSGGYAAAADLTKNALTNLRPGSVKRELVALNHAIEGYAAWDRFDHKAASNHFGHSLSCENDLSAIFCQDVPLLVAEIKKGQATCQKLDESSGPTWHLVDDLLHNSQRRAGEQRFDDATARMYRACEAIAQVRLREQHQIPNTSTVSIAQVPMALQDQWGPQIKSGFVSIGLQQAFKLLESIGDDLGKLFNELGLGHAESSPLVARNSSILAHGFKPVSKGCYDQLQKKVLQLRGSEFVQRDEWRLPKVR